MVRKLEACSCGGRPAVKSVSYIKGRWFWVQCGTCLTRSSDLPTLDGAVDNWNERAGGKAKGTRESAGETKKSTPTRRAPTTPRAPASRARGTTRSQRRK
jgi:hypothetical protein